MSAKWIFYLFFINVTFLNESWSQSAGTPTSLRPSVSFIEPTDTSVLRVLKPKNQLLDDDIQKVFVVREDFEDLHNKPLVANGKSLFGYIVKTKVVSVKKRVLVLVRYDELNSGDVVKNDSIYIEKYVFTHRTSCEMIERLKILRMVQEGDLDASVISDSNVRRLVTSHVQNFTREEESILRDHVFDSDENGLSVLRIENYELVRDSTHLAFLGYSQIKTLLNHSPEFLVFSGAKLEIGKTIFDRNAPDEYFTWKVEAVNIDYNGSSGPDCSSANIFGMSNSASMGSTPLIVTAEPCPPFWHNGQ